MQEKFIIRDNVTITKIKRSDKEKINNLQLVNSNENGNENENNGQLYIFKEKQE